MGLAALPEERLVQAPPPPIWAGKTRFTLILLCCFLLHATPIYLYGRAGTSDAPAPQEQETPVEVIVEPPPPEQPEPPKPKNEQKAEQLSLDSKLATDAPRAPNEEKVLNDAKDDASHAPVAKPKAEPVQEKPENPPAPSPEKTREAKAAETSAPKPMDQSPEGEPVKPAELERPVPQEQAKAETPQPEQPKPAAPDPLAAFSALPDYAFAPASKYKPVNGGKAASTYLSVLYDMVGSRIKVPAAAAGRVHEMGEIAFNIDLTGRLVRMRVVKSSGSPELDAAAMAAIRAAAPFPPTPTGTEISLNLRYGGN